MNKKRIAKIMLGVMLLTGVFAKGTFPQAKAFLMALAPQTEWRAKDAPDLQDTKDNGNRQDGYVKLDKIQDADSYTMLAKAVKYPGSDLKADYNTYSVPRAIRQGAGKVRIDEGYDNKIMQVGETYYLALQNLNYTRDYRNAIGSFGWY